ncbi:MAG: sigma-70 family RNA polymerase sigma factor, partial [Planctomycetota bacterium]|nr:sigma-70 family RNA polymerase sigma factor [Planctomycetota bacterium]
MKNTAPTSIAPLLERMDRIRNLARTLVRDAATADDLVQEALMVALAADGRGAQPKTMGWMRVVMGNLVRDGRRSEEGRTRREGRVAAGESSAASAEAVVSNAERQRDIVEAVLELEDPYREVMLLRHFEDCPPREIARRTGRPVETVRKQLQRGHERLRAKLEGRYGDRGRWAVALLPVTGDGVLRGLGGGVGGSLTTMKATGALIAVGIVGLVGSQAPGWLSSTPSQRVTGVQAPIGTSPTAIEDAPTLAAARAAEREDVSIADAAQEQPQALNGRAEGVVSEGPPLEARDVLLTGLDGQPLAERDVVWEFALGEWMEDRWKSEGRLIEARTDATGRASLLLPPHPALERNLWRIDGAAMLAVGIRNETERGAWRVVLAPAVRVAGQVRDRDGAPVQGARVKGLAGVEAVATFSLPPTGFSAGNRTAVTDATGAFDFPWLPTHPAFVLQVEADEHHDSRVPMPSYDSENLVLNTGRRGKVALSISGVVLESGGGPAAGISVNFGHQRAKTNSAGRFTIEVPHAPTDKPITASADDGRFAVAKSPVESDAASLGGPDGLIDDAVTLRLPAETLRLRVRLLDAGGEPMEGCKVVPFDGT